MPVIYQRRLDGKFLTEDEIVTDLLENLDEEEVAILLRVPRDLLVTMHPTVGRDIRNAYGLWEADNPHVRHDAPLNAKGVNDDPLHPDQFSMRVIERVWEKVQEIAGQVA